MICDPPAGREKKTEPFGSGAGRFSATCSRPVQYNEQQPRGKWDQWTAESADKQKSNRSSDGSSIWDLTEHQPNMSHSINPGLGSCSVRGSYLANIIILFEMNKDWFCSSPGWSGLNSVKWVLDGGSIRAEDQRSDQIQLNGCFVLCERVCSGSLHLELSLGHFQISISDLDRSRPVVLKNRENNLPPFSSRGQKVCLIVCGWFPGGGVGNHTPPETQLACWVKELLGLLTQRVHDVTSCPAGGDVWHKKDFLKLAGTQTLNGGLRV